MLIDPWIVLAEIFNFVILVVVLKRFLYKPVIRAMAQREQSIASQVQSAEAREAEAQAQIAQYQQLQAEWADQIKARRYQMQQALEAESTQNKEKIRLEMERQSAQWDEALRQEQKASLVNLRDRARSQLIQTVRAALQTLANTSLEQQMVEAFLIRIKTLLPADIDALRAAVDQQSDPKWTIRTAFPLDQSLQRRLIRDIKALLSAQFANQAASEFDGEAFTFETYSEYPCGIELRTGGYKLAWHLEHYLDSLESRLAYDLEQVPVL